MADMNASTSHLPRILQTPAAPRTKVRQATPEELTAAIAVGNYRRLLHEARRTRDTFRAEAASAYEANDPAGFHLYSDLGDAASRTVEALTGRLHAMGDPA